MIIVMMMHIPNIKSLYPTDFLNGNKRIHNKIYDDSYNIVILVINVN